MAGTEKRGGKGTSIPKKGRKSDVIVGGGGKGNKKIT